MRRVLHIFSLLGLALSILLGIGILALWVHSYFQTDWVVRVRAWRDKEGAKEEWVQVFSIRGKISLGPGHLYATNPDSPENVDVYQLASRLAGRSELHFRSEPNGPNADSLPGAWMPIRVRKWGYWNPQVGTDIGGRDLIIHHWLAALVFLSAPVWWGAKWIKRRRRLKTGWCIACGYDLRASPERCPECGAAATT